MRITRSTLADEPQFSDFWNSAREYQSVADLPRWPAYPRELIRAEIHAGRHFSAWRPDRGLVGCFSLTLSDPDIWGPDEKDDAIYLHRMCVAMGSRQLGAVPNLPSHYNYLTLALFQNDI